MRIGISIATMQLTRDHREGARNIIARAGRARDAGLDSLFVGDHHVTAAPYYQNSPMLGRILAEWDHRDCGALYLLPLWNPVLVAEPALADVLDEAHVRAGRAAAGERHVVAPPFRGEAAGGDDGGGVHGQARVRGRAEAQLVAAAVGRLGRRSVRHVNTF